MAGALQFRDQLSILMSRVLMLRKVVIDLLPIVSAWKS